MKETTHTGMQQVFLKTIGMLTTSVFEEFIKKEIDSDLYFDIEFGTKNQGGLSLHIKIKSCIYKNKKMLEKAK